MGDMADYVNEMIEEEYEARYKWRSGNMSWKEAYDSGVVDEYGAEYGSTSTITCRYCGEGNLLWNATEKGWRLFKNGKLHSCY